MAVIRNIHNVRDPASIRPWLRTVAINSARLAARTANARPKLRLVGESFDDEAVHNGDNSAASDTKEDANAVLQQVLALPEMYREPLLLRAVHNMSYERMAETLELSVEAVESRIVRARKMIRERTQGNGRSAAASAVPS